MPQNLHLGLDKIVAWACSHVLSLALSLSLVCLGPSFNQHTLGGLKPGSKLFYRGYRGCMGSLCFEGLLGAI